MERNHTYNIEKHWKYLGPLAANIRNIVVRLVEKIKVNLLDIYNLNGTYQIVVTTSNILTNQRRNTVVWFKTRAVLGDVAFQSVLKDTKSKQEAS